MPEYVLNRNFLLRTTLGHSVAFQKGVPTWVPKAIERDAQQIGAERVDGAAPDMLDPEAPPAGDVSFEEMREQIEAAFALLVEKNDPADFTGAGVPKVAAVEKLTELNLDRADVIKVWAEWKAGR